MPVFNTDNPMVREYLMRIAEHWVEEGIDGWRLDVPNEIKSEGFWEEFRERIKRVNPQAYIVGELWGESRAWLQGDRFDAVMNYVFTDSVISFVSGERTRPELVSGMGYKPWPPRSGVEYADRIDWLLEMYPRGSRSRSSTRSTATTPREYYIAGGDEASVRLAVLCLHFPGLSIYYGDEIGRPAGARPAGSQVLWWTTQRAEHLAA
ncbi:MAG: alpha-amylase family glycosyl hydrolase [Chloroflexia bacterium]